MRLAFVGYGTIVSKALEILARELEHPLPFLGILTRPGAEAKAELLLQRLGSKIACETAATSDVRALLGYSPSIVAEAAGHEALSAYGPAILSAGCELILTSVGALADENLQLALSDAAAAGLTSFAPIPGAIGALDILAAAKLSGLTSVTYTGRKPPQAWKGTPAEKQLKLEGIKCETVIFEGPAGSAVRLFPQNANVAATLALAGAGFENTKVRLIADPTISRNVHEISVVANCASFHFCIEGAPAPDNPKTSLTVAYSLASEILQRASARSSHAVRPNRSIPSP